MRRNVVISLVLAGLLLFFLFFLKNSGIFKNLKIRTIEQVNEEKRKYALKNSPFYKEYHTTNQLIVLNVWATWCKPCLEEIPLLNQIKNHYSGQNKIVFLSLSLDDDSTKLKSFLNSDRFHFQDITLKNFQYRKALTDYLDGNETSQNSFINIKTNVLPSTYILKDKKVLDVYTEIDSNIMYKKIDACLSHVN